LEVAFLQLEPIAGLRDVFASGVRTSPASVVFLVLNDS
jgi:hypothetical protein